MALTQHQLEKLPEELQLLVKSFRHDTQLLPKLKYLLVSAGQVISQYSINHQSFCDTFKVPYKIIPVIQKLFNMNTHEIKVQMRKIGFVDIHRQYSHEYYQTLCLCYLIGLDHDDKAIRRMSILLIDIRLWNGVKQKRFPNFCDEDTAKYVLNYVLRDHHTLKKTGSAFKYLDEFSIPAVDDKYKNSIANDLNSFSEGLIKLIVANRNRFAQLFQSISDAYYKTYTEGKKEITTSSFENQYGEGDLIETRETFSNTIEKLVDKIQKNSFLRKNSLEGKDAKEVLKGKFIISDRQIALIDKWIYDEENHEELHHFYELIFNSFKPKNEHDICKYDVEILAKKVSGAKKDPYLIKAKSTLDNVAYSLVGDKVEAIGQPRLYQLKMMISFALIIHAKIMLCRGI